MCRVYFISDSVGSVKIGKADNVVKRVKELQTASSEHLKLLGTITCSDSSNAHNVEKLLHSVLQKQHKRGEWFNLTENHSLRIIKSFENVKVSFEEKVKNTNLPNFTKVGNGKMNKHGIQSLDFLQEVMDMTKAEQLVIATIKNLYEWDNVTGEVHIPLSRMFDKQKTKTFLKGFGLLKKKDLVRRTKTGHYMINPNAVFLQSYEEGLKLWNKSENT